MKTLGTYLTVLILLNITGISRIYARDEFSRVIKRNLP